MAVVSISRIQVRRGRKNEGSGLPQLASGEIGWAIDTQELFIGNGSVSEGAPYVGNTKILTEHDNVLEFSKGYEYRSNDQFIQTGSSANSPVVRTILERLDDRVSVRSFGATGNGTDQTAELQRAIYQLFLNPVTVGTITSRVVLHIEPGEYVISNTIYIPPYTTIVGSGIDKTIIRMTGSGPAFQTISSESTELNPVSDSLTMSVDNQARNIDISNLTLNTENNLGLNLTNCRNSIFQNIKIQGNWTSNNYNPDTDGIFYGIILNSRDGIVTCKDNQFENVTVKNVPYAIYADNNIQKNTWKNCIFDTLYTGIAFGRDAVLNLGPAHNTIFECTFDNINRQAILIAEGEYNSSFQNRFFSVGNNGGDESNSQFAVIEFVSSKNITKDDWFARSEQLSYLPISTGVPYIPTVLSPSIHEENFTHILNIGQVGSLGLGPERLFKLPGDKIRSYEVDYLYVSSAVDAKRSGTFTIITDPGRNDINIVDEYSYLGDSTYSENLRFTARNDNIDNINSVDTVSVLLLNITQADDAKLYFRVKTKA